MNNLHLISSVVIRNYAEYQHSLDWSFISDLYAILHSNSPSYWESWKLCHWWKEICSMSKQL